MTWKMANFSPHQPAMSVFYVYRSGSFQTYSIFVSLQLPNGHQHHAAPRSSWQRLPDLVLYMPNEYTKTTLAVPPPWKMANFSPHQPAMSVFYVYRSGSCETYSIIGNRQLPAGPSPPPRTAELVAKTATFGIMHAIRIHQTNLGRSHDLENGKL